MHALTGEILHTLHSMLALSSILNVKYRHVPVHFIFCMGTLLLNRLVQTHIGTLFTSAPYTKQTRKENSDVSSLFPDSLFY